VERRTFLRWLMSGAVALPLRCVHLHAQVATLPSDSLATLRAVAAVVLPSELRAAGHDRMINEFVQWLASYRSGADRDWGYGNPRKNGTATIDTAKYVSQLRLLEERAGARGASLAALPDAARRDLVIEALEHAGVRDLPSFPDGRHVIGDVMSFYFNSPVARDLVYLRRIARHTCRGLAGAAARPTAVAGD
jgi:hypothetical protein